MDGPAWVGVGREEGGAWFWRGRVREGERGREGESGGGGEVGHGEISGDAFAGGGGGDPGGGGEEAVLVEGCMQGGEFSAGLDDFDGDDCGAGRGAGEELEMGCKGVRLGSGREVEGCSAEDARGDVSAVGDCG